ncbi:MotA/TolQ/ExbB proton channel family protein [Methanobrevibacter ruminantium M1]|uniref:MotA/TolQ/ExbB proton channel family protein n=1 Tax=Methanobrevibacter ruminantium (strain ATCC 35063 / DSM 1093 / JCM 13430 / OCM 146 / M1) TaxID=634498 RepID=D3E0S1_METRM|nr:MotA/TolQ/ExbB proton channel family protein [Methanobrevibacter ruminantium]ADC47895.1 MotA/TolQ/ExbB proton channel family protein [Methanobrevibacter ruminantium M1]
MVTVIPGSDLLTSALNVVSQSLQIPVIVFLLIFAVYAVITVGGLISEYSSRKKVPVKVIKDLIYAISRSEDVTELENILKNARIPKNQKRVLINIARSGELKKDSREALAEKLIENEEDIIEKKLQKTDIVTKIGPTLGLMGTLIPMGPGLAALGSGDVTTLSNAIIVAFDTTVVGIGSGAVAYVVSKVRRRWYEQYLSNLDALSKAVLDRLNE